MLVSARNALAGSERDLERTIGSPWFTDRGISRSLGIFTSGVRPTIVATSSSVMPTRESARLRTNRMWLCW